MIEVEQPRDYHEMADELVSRMQAGIVTFAYKKKSTEEVRIARGTLDETLFHYESKNSGRKPAEDTITYWDIDKGGWRSLKIENILQICN